MLLFGEWSYLVVSHSTDFGISVTAYIQTFKQCHATKEPRVTQLGFVWFYQLGTYSASLSLFNRLSATALWVTRLDC